MKAFSKVTVAANMAFAVAISFFGCSSDDGGDPNTGGGVSSSSVGGGIESVTIGTQVWMKKNLDVEVDGSKCYDELPANCETYGRLYDWVTAQTVCSGGWHLPDSTAWDVLKNYIENDNECTWCAGKYLKSISGWNGGSNGLDSYGFNALPGGVIIVSSDGTETSDYIGVRGYWWTATDHNNATNGHGRNLRDGDHLDKGNGSKTGLRSVRCIKD